MLQGFHEFNGNETKISKDSENYISKIYFAIRNTDFDALNNNTIWNRILFFYNIFDTPVMTDVPNLATMSFVNKSACMDIFSDIWPQDFGMLFCSRERVISSQSFIPKLLFNFTNSNVFRKL